MPGFVVVPQNGLVAGKTYPEWTAAWWQWVTAISAAQSPLTDTTGAFCTQGQSGPVFFLAGEAGVMSSTFTRACTIPTGKYLFLPILNYLNDFPCPDPTFKPFAGQTLEEFLRAGAVAQLGAPSVLTIDVDGASFPDTDNYRFTSKMFDFTGDISLKANFDPCIIGSVQQGASDGWWIMIEPLAPGAHKLHFKGTNTANGPAFTIDGTYNLTVQ